MEIHVDMRFTGPLAVLKLSGDLDMSTEDHLSWGVEQAIGRRCTCVAVDLAGVPFIDCSAVGTLVQAAHRLREVSGELVVTAASPQVVRLLELTGTAGAVGLRDGAPVVGVMQPA